MSINWNEDVGLTAILMNQYGTRELRWFGITIGQVGFGILVSVERAEQSTHWTLRLWAWLKNKIGLGLRQ